jgi:DNA-binding response OmpR family regulator
MVILLIEDEDNILELEQNLVSLAGYMSDTAKDGEEAITKIDSRVYDLIILDVILPKINGLDVLRHIQKASLNWNTPIILVTALGKEVTIMLPKHTTTNIEIITKPFTNHSFIKMIKNSMSNPSKVVE